MAELYVLANVDKDGNITGFPKGGGSSTSPRIKAYETLESAKRGARHHAGVIIRCSQNGMEVVEWAV